MQLIHFTHHFGDKRTFDPPAQAALGFQVRVFLREMNNSRAGFPIAQPILVAAVSPFGNVVLGDGPAGEMRGEDLPDFGQLIEPGHSVFGEGAVEQELVELLADRFGEAGDFTGASFHGIFCHRDTEIQRSPRGSDGGARRAPLQVTACSLSFGVVLARI